MNITNSKNMVKSFTAFALFVAGSSAMAGSTWDLTACSTGSNLGATESCVVPGGAAGLFLSGFSNGTGTSAAPGVTSSGANFAAASIYDWGTSAGLGVVSTNESSGATGPHAIDNGYGIDALMLNFTGGPVSMTGLTIGWNATDSNSKINNANTSNQTSNGAINYNDSDLSVFAWTGAAGKTAATSVSPTGLMDANSGWTLIGNYANVGAIAGNAQGISSAIYSSYWLISAYSTAYGGTGLDQGNDAFKLLTVAGNTCTTTVTNGTCGGTSTKVPEPGSLALLGLGLVGLVASRRRSQKAA